MGKIGCRGCGGKGQNYVQKETIDPRNPKKRISKGVWEKCKVCGGTGKQ